MKTRRNCVVSLLICILLLMGCQQQSENTNMPESENEVTQVVYEEEIFDKEQVNGKMAAYFFESTYEYTDVAGTQDGGDATLFVAPDGTTILVDFSTAMNSARIVEALQRLDITKLDYVVLTTQLPEHIGGYSNIMRHMEIGQIYTNHHEYSLNGSYEKLRKAVDEYQIPLSYVYAGDVLNVGQDVQIEILSPENTYDQWKEKQGTQDGSLVFKITYKESSFLIGGDISVAQEEALVEKYGEALSADVVRMNNHGQDGSNGKTWVQTIGAKVVCGQSSVPPSSTVMGRWEVSGSVALHTALDGTCLVYTDGTGAYELQVKQDRITAEYGVLELEKGYLAVGGE